MNGLHGIIFAYEKAPGLRELTEARMAALHGNTVSLSIS